ncbi:hypothetical protein AB4163_16880 [Vibrio splendidus]
MNSLLKALIQQGYKAKIERERISIRFSNGKQFCLGAIKQALSSHSKQFSISHLALLGCFLFLTLTTRRGYFLWPLLLSRKITC